MSEQAAPYAIDPASPAVRAQRASDELSALHDALALAMGRASTLGAEAEAALDAMYVAVPVFRGQLALLLDDADAARQHAAGLVDAALGTGVGR